MMDFEAAGADSAMGSKTRQCRYCLNGFSALNLMQSSVYRSLSFVFRINAIRRLSDV